MGTLFHSYTIADGGQILEIWGMTELEWYFGVMVKALNPYWPHPRFILDVCKCFSAFICWGCGHMGAPLTLIPFAGGGQISENWGWLSLSDIVVSKLRLQTPFDCIPHSYWMSAKWFCTFICWGCGHMGAPLHLFLLQEEAKFLKIGDDWAWVTLWCNGWGCKPPLTASHIHIGCPQSVLALSYAEDVGI